MAELLLDVHLDLDPLEFIADLDPTRTIYEMSHAVAVERCAERGAVLRHPDPRETVVKDGTHPITGQPVLLVSTRWIADGPA